MKRILCVPLDPVHDVGIKLVRNALMQRGHSTVLLSPDLPMESVVKRAASEPYDFVLVSRTLGYGVAELLGRFVDLLDASGVRDRAKVVLGGKAITRELAAELGFDAGFGEHAAIEEVVAFVEGREYAADKGAFVRRKRDMTAPYGYAFHDASIRGLLDEIADKTLHWAERRSSNGVERARLRAEWLDGAPGSAEREGLEARYERTCDPAVVAAMRGGAFPNGVRRISEREMRRLAGFLESRSPVLARSVRHEQQKPLVFKFLGSGCPMLDIVHGRICERWGADGFLLINPSWEARYEGLMQGLLTHDNDGTISSLDNLRLVRESLDPETLLTVRAHRGLNTPETVLLAARAGADLTKIDIVYGSLGAGTDPERLTVDGLEAMRIAARHSMPFDIPGNDELSGVPAWKTLAGLLINVMLGVRLGARPILKPLFCYGPHIVINGQMKHNFVDYNAAKITALRRIVDCPIWPGEPIAFMTQTEERVQSANATSYHAALAMSLGVDAITLASTDEAYSRGPISVAARIDALRAVADAYRFVGDASLAPTPQAAAFCDELVARIAATLLEVSRAESLPAAISAGLLGNQDDGAYPGTFGKGSVH